MLSNYYTFQALVAEALQVLRGATIRESFSQEKDELILTFREDLPGLVFSCRPGANTFFMAPGIARARRNTASVLSGVEGKTIRDFRMSNTDRVTSLLLDDGSTLVGQFFGSVANVMLVHPSGTIEEAFRNNKQLHGTVLEVTDREQIFDLSALQTLSDRFPGKPVSAAVRSLFPPLGATLTTEVLFRAQCAGGTAVDALAQAVIDRLGGALQQVLLEVQRPAPRIYENSGGEAVLFSLISLAHAAQWGEQCHASVHEAVRTFYRRRRSSSSLDGKKLTVLTQLRQQLEKAQRTIDALREESARGERSTEYEQAGNLLLAHLDTVRKGDKTVVLALERSEQKIVLDPRLNAVQNAQRYFDKAKKARSATALAATRLRHLEGRVARGAAFLETLEQITDPTEWKQTMKEQAGALGEFGLGKEGVTPQLPFRRFVVEGGFEVWAGKSSENNDELTLHHARPRDLWFHARGSSGSHVILRIDTGKGEPGKKAREQAAAIAAYYSKMKKAGLVPVAMTEKRYVRKPKGAKAGAVTLERESVVFVRPALPPESSASDREHS